jgi:carboxyl-terminal processing protease
MEPRSAVPGWRGAPGTHDDAAVAPEPTSRLIDGRFALVRLPQLDTIGTGGEDVARAYTAAVRTALERMDREHLCGWIVDLRGNGGGNMWPMLRGLGPLLGEPPFGAFATRDARLQPWIRANRSV